MPSVYIDQGGAVRSRASGAIVAPAGTSARQARMKAALWAAAADALAAAPPAPTPITAAPSYVRAVPEAREKLAVIDVNQLRADTLAELEALTRWPSCP